MDVITPIVDALSRLWVCTARRTVYFCDLEENLNHLEKKTEHLKKLSEDVKTRIQLARDQHMIPTNEVSIWLEDVQKMETEVAELRQDSSQELQNKCLGNCCPKNCSSTYKLGKRVSKNISEVEGLRKTGDRFNHIDNIAERMPRAVVDVMPMEKTVGLEKKLDEVWTYIGDQKAGGVIGLYGMGGVGKTTLMKKLNNEFAERSHDFEHVIWVVVSKEGTDKRVQDAILTKLALPADRSFDENAAEISRHLTGKKFVLLLDDIWKRIELTKLGVPLPDRKNKSKIIFTTRSEEVCGRMDASQTIRVECLMEKEAIDLFQEKVGEKTLSDPEIRRLSEAAARECAGMPLALITIGRAMANKKTVEEWNHVLTILRNFPARSSDMRNDVFPILRFSYDSLPDDIQKVCFTYCSLFPEDYDIDTEELVNLWFGEGILNEFVNIDEARNLGFTMIGDLKRACMLEIGKSEKSVKLHDVMRDMALWIATECKQKTDNFVVKSLENQPVKDRDVGKWEKAERISLFGVERFEVSSSLQFHNLESFYVRDSMLKSLPSGLFCSMSVIKVLDLSHNSELTKLPSEIGKLGLLQYLNLSKTKITELPPLSDLVKLRYLGLSDTTSLKIIPRQLKTLSDLQVLDMWNCGDDQVDFGKEFFQELENMKELVYVKLTIKGASEHQSFMRCPKLQSIARGILLKKCDKLTSSSLLNHVKCLNELEIDDCSTLKDLTWKQRSLENLHSVTIRECPSLDHLNWLAWAPNLRFLRVIKCASMQEVVQDTGVMDIFSRLELLQLSELPDLSSIYNHPLLFPCLKEIQVFQCSKLKKLPLDSNSATNSLIHRVVPPSWWKDLEWKDEATERKFSPFVASGEKEKEKAKATTSEASGQASGSFKRRR